MTRGIRKHLLFFLSLAIASVLFSTPALNAAENTGKRIESAKEIRITTDHSKHIALQQTFRSGDQITAACVSCHSEAENQFHKTIHWNWLDPNTDTETLTGKAGHSVNNFCISTNGMQDKKCLSCHAGWNGKTDGVNCLLCHGQEPFNFREAFDDFEYFAKADDAESKDIAAEIQNDLRNAVQAITRPTRQNCGSCHFFGGGGDGVKHGDLDSSLFNPGRTQDVHMDTGGQNFQCVRCHTTTLHNIAGRIYSTPAATNRKSLVEDDLASKITCESCHSQHPHKAGAKANDHTDKVACQSCHIPKYARTNPTKLWWDWSAAGKKKNGKPYTETGPFGKDNYMSIKGEMKWGKNLIPEYFWFNGSIHTLTVKDIIDPKAAPVQVSWPLGARKDQSARIFPFKVHRGKQPYDLASNTLLAPLLSGPDGFWETLDWQNALAKGMAFLNMPFSGRFDFVETSYVFPITHMVAPIDDMVHCTECHTKKDSRLQNLAGFYMPGRDRFKVLTVFGWTLVLGSLIGVILHALGRIVAHVKQKKE